MIHTARLDLVPMTPPVLRALLAGELGVAGELLGAVVPADWEVSRYALELRLSQLEADPALQPWLMRAMVVREAGEMVGDIGFHGAPGTVSLDESGSGGAEFGYGVVERWQRQGIATEAARALMSWARETHGVSRFVLSISPENLPSLGMAAKLGFYKIGSQMDEIDGPEDVFEFRDPDRAR